MNIGEQIRELREKQNMELEDLALGICTDESLRNVELGKESINKLLMEILFQRLGKSTDKLEFIVSEEVYEEEQRKEQYEELLERGEGEQAERVLEEFMKDVPQDSRVHQMYYCRSKAYAELRLKQNPVKAKEWMQKALDITMPGWQVTPLENYWISTMELENLLAYAKTQIAIGTEPENTEAEALLMKCRYFMDSRITDGEEHAKIFVKCAYLLSKLYLEQGKVTRAEEQAEQALQELQEYGMSYFMQPVLQVLVQCNAGSAEEGKPPYHKYLEALTHLKEHVGEDWHFEDSVFKNCSQQTYYIDHELFREERIAQGYSQESMIEGIYKNPESLSRAERGKVTMRDSKLIKLFRKLGIEKCRYNGFVVTDNYEVLELKQKVDILLSRKCIKEADENLRELKSRLDLRISENRRWICGYEIMISNSIGTISKEELLEQAMDLLQETYRLRTHGVYRVPMDREVTIINQIGILLRQLGRKEEAIRLFRDVMIAMKNSKVSLKKRYREYSLLAANLAKWKCSVPMAQENIKFEVSCGKLRLLAMNYITEACALIDDPANREICRKMMRDVYYLCELAMNELDKGVIEQYYRDKFKEEVC